MAYFATQQGKDLVDALQARITQYYNFLNSSGRIGITQTAYREYYISRHDSVGVRQDQNNRLKVNVSELRNITQYTMSLLANKPAAFSPVATNGDAKSQRQTKVAANVVDYYTDEKSLDQWFRDALELAIVSSEAWGVVSWNPMAGKEYGADEEGKPVYQGDIEFSIHDMTDVVRDVGKRKSVGDNLWLIVRRQINKYELSGQYPEFAKQIEESTTNYDVTKEINKENFSNVDTDEIYYWEFRHEKCTVVPKGRIVKFLEDGTVLEDIELPYKNMAIKKLSPSKEMLSNFSWTTNFDLVGFQQALSKLYSIILTNQSAFGYQNLVTTKDSGVNVSEVSKGLRLFQLNAGTTLEPLKLLATPQEIFTGLDVFGKKSEQLSGLNSVVRGNPEASLKSGTALALVVSQAVSYLSTLDASFNNFQQDIMTLVIDMLKSYATTPRMIAIAGISNANVIIDSFTAEDISDIDRVVVKQTNPMTKTIAGRVNLAEMMLNSGQITPEQYYNVLATGEIQYVLEAKTAQVTLIKSENEALSQGKPAPVLRTDNHEQHISEHLVLLNDPVLRLDPVLTANVLNHVAEHEGYLGPVYAQGGQQPQPQGAGGPPPPQGMQPGVETTEGQQIPVPAPPANLPEGTPPEFQQMYAEALPPQ